MRIAPSTNHLLIEANFLILEVIGIQYFLIDFSADDLGSNHILILKRESHLLKNIICFLFHLHRSERFNLG